MQNTTEFMGLTCVELANASLSLLVTQSVGPRIIALRQGGGQNLLAELPDATLDCPGAGRLRLWGGHRLWHAPEVRQRSYLPDDQPVDIEPIRRGLHITQAVEAVTGLQKSLTVTLPDESPTVVIDHTLTNRGVWRVECAAWAITMLRPGGTAVLPLNQAAADPDGLLPNRSVALWPYTDPASPRLGWSSEALRIHADRRQEGALKVGIPNPRGWLAYWLDGALLVKWARWDATAVYYDLNTSSQCYTNGHMLELETLSPSTAITPDTTLTHREVWQLFRDVPSIAGDDALRDIIARLELDVPHPLL